MAQCSSGLDHPQQVSLPAWAGHLVSCTGRLARDSLRSCWKEDEKKRRKDERERGRGRERESKGREEGKTRWTSAPGNSVSQGKAAKPARPLWSRQEGKTTGENSSASLTAVNREPKTLDKDVKGLGKKREHQLVPLKAPLWTPNCCNYCYVLKGTICTPVMMSSL